MQRAGKIAGRLRTALDLLSNGTPVDVPESQLLEIVDEAGEQFKENLFKQLSQREREFKLRMSAFGRPLCQLQRDKANVKGAPRDYNFALRMMLGDAAEALIWALVRCAGLEVTGAKEPATLVLNCLVSKLRDLRLQVVLIILPHTTIRQADPWKLFFDFRQRFVEQRSNLLVSVICLMTFLRHAEQHSLRLNHGFPSRLADQRSSLHSHSHFSWPMLQDPL